CQDNRPLRSENLQRAPDGDTKCARIEAVGILLDEECYLERMAPGRRQHRQDALEHALEQVAKAGMSQPPLRFRRPRYEDTESPFTGGRDTGNPEGRLPDPRLALQRERDRTVLVTVEARVYGGALHHPPHYCD